MSAGDDDRSKSGANTPAQGEPSSNGEATGSNAADDAFDAVAAAAELAEMLGEEAAPPPTAEQLLQREVLELSQLIDKRNAELAVAHKRAQVAEAEVDRVKERVEREAAKQLEGRVRKILLGFLEVLDDLDRALVSINEDVADGDATQEVVRGVELVRSSFLAKLRSFGVTHLPSAGQPFDPNFHEAMTTVSVQDPAQSGKVVGVIREGYLIGDELLRPAGVAVGRG